MGPSFWQMLIILIIVLLLFGTNRLRNLGSDLGQAIKGFRNAMSEGEQDQDKDKDKLEQRPAEKVINSEENHRDKV